MSDSRLQQLKRAWEASGSVEAEAGYLSAVVRAGAPVEPFVELLSLSGYPAVACALGDSTDIGFDRAPDLSSAVRWLVKEWREPGQKKRLKRLANGLDAWFADFDPWASTTAWDRVVVALVKLVGWAQGTSWEEDVIPGEVLVEGGSRLFDAVSVACRGLDYGVVTVVTDDETANFPQALEAALNCRTTAWLQTAAHVASCLVEMESNSKVLARLLIRLFVRDALGPWVVGASEEFMGVDLVQVRTRRQRRSTASARAPL